MDLAAQAHGKRGGTPARSGRASLRDGAARGEDLAVRGLQRVEADFEPALQAPAGVPEVAVARRRQKMNERGEASDQRRNLDVEAALRAGVPNADPVNERRVMRGKVVEIDGSEPALARWRRPATRPCVVDA